MSKSHYPSDGLALHTFAIHGRSESLVLSERMISSPEKGTLQYKLEVGAADCRRVR